MGIIVVATGIFVLLSVVGFIWANKLILENSFVYLSQLDVSSMSGAVTAAVSAAVVLTLLYFINYPEGQLARDVAAEQFKTKSEAKKAS